MKVEKYIEREITAITENETELIFRNKFRSLIYFYYVDKAKIDFLAMEYIRRYNDGTHRLFIIVDNKDNYIQLKSTKRIAKLGVPIDKYVDREFPKIDYINYYQYDLFVQLDGITAIVGMSGAGKTYSALSMLGLYSDYFTKIAYLNYELTDRDIIKRFKETLPDKRLWKTVFDKLYIRDGIMTSLDLDEILEAMDVMPEDRVVFVVDNVGSVIGQEENVFRKQNEFLKELDVVCKERGYHALALTQTVKDHNMGIFDDDGEIKGSINMSIMAGSIMLGNLARTVLFTGYNGNTNEFKQKVLKRGTGVLYSERGVNPDDDYIRR